jgi:hypothetical protein
MMGKGNIVGEQKSQGLARRTRKKGRVTHPVSPFWLAAFGREGEVEYLLPASGITVCLGGLKNALLSSILGIFGDFPFGRWRKNFSHFDWPRWFP